MSGPYTRISGETTPSRKQADDEVRARAMEEFPPAEHPAGPSAKGRIAIAIREARRSRGLSYEQLADLAGIADPKSVQSIEYGDDVNLSDVTAVAEALGLRLELVTAEP
jgi:ribosome-binding protein aMBF1 (putative translation factor)